MKGPEKVRSLILERLESDFMGPIYGRKEEIDFASKGPDSEYLTGKLYPKKTKVEEEEKQRIAEEAGYTPIEQDLEKEIEKKFDKPSSMGLSFFLQNSASAFELKLQLEAGVYQQKKKEIITEKKEEKKIIKVWKRKQQTMIATFPVDLEPNSNGSKFKTVKTDDGVEGLKIRYKTRKWKNLLQVSVFIVNTHSYSDEETYIAHNEKIFFQAGFKISANKNCEIVKFPSDSSYIKEDTLNALLYRDKSVYAVGHTCSADWRESDNGTLESIETSWIPRYFVPDVDETGHHSINEIYNAAKIGESKPEALLKRIKTLPSLYQGWISDEKEKISRLSGNFSQAAEDQLTQAERLFRRMERSIHYMESNKELLSAFKLANKAMVKTASWNKIDDLNWRPFQLGFVLLTLQSAIDSKSPDRELADLLWFPTGGGKTEAYLLLMATVLFYRKLKKGSLNSKDGLGVFTRYTLRALTLDQFKRLAGTVSACEIVRREAISESEEENDTNNNFSLGMWVGEAATPNTFIAAKEDKNKIKVIKECPCCNDPLEWGLDEQREMAFAKCNSAVCEISTVLRTLPIHVIDEEIYRVVPSVIIGTVDKFVQVIRRPKDARKIFGLEDGNIEPPDLIIQDELHLISGPLGTMVGGIELIIGALCENDQNIGPKIIGSTATIQRAGDQILGLYAKPFNQFPVNITNVDDSFFAVTKEDSPGRIYAGVTTACSSATYCLQAVSAILLQAIKSKKIEQFENMDIDPYSTLVAYFNNLRTLRGATILLQEDTKASIAGYASRREEDEITYDNPEELTGSIEQSELEDILVRLEKDKEDNDHIAILLASVMISVGLDIARLGLMVVDSQPKTIAEYIQATSRVGRNKIPGLILTVFNEYRPRDKSHYENFKNLHTNLYRFVESTSVTPFAPRARQKILPAILVTLSIRELNLDNSYGINEMQAKTIRDKVIPKILKRVEIIDPLEIDDTKLELESIIEKWLARGSIGTLWNDYNELGSLLISAEAYSAKKAVGVTENVAFQSPNSARNVEASVRIKARKTVSDRSLRG